MFPSVSTEQLTGVPVDRNKAKLEDLRALICQHLIKNDVVVSEDGEGYVLQEQTNTNTTFEISLYSLKELTDLLSAFYFANEDKHISIGTGGRLIIPGTGDLYIFAERLGINNPGLGETIEEFINESQIFSVRQNTSELDTTVGEGFFRLQDDKVVTAAIGKLRDSANRVTAFCKSNEHPTESLRFDFRLRLNKKEILKTIKLLYGIRGELFYYQKHRKPFDNNSTIAKMSINKPKTSV